jgi:hypothetical protein
MTTHVAFFIVIALPISPLHVIVGVATIRSDQLQGEVIVGVRGGVISTSYLRVIWSSSTF